MRQRNEHGSLFEEEPFHPETDSGDDRGDLTAALRRCAAGDRTAIEDLRAWEGQRLRSMLLRMLGDPVVADRVLDTALADLFSNAAMLEALGRGPAEDRVFALVRRHAYAALRSARPPGITPPPAPAPQPVATLPYPAAATPDPPPPPTMRTEERVRSAPIPAALGVVTPLEPPTRLRRPGAHDDLEDEVMAPEPLDDEDEPRPRRWLRLVLAWVVAAAAGFALTYLVANLVLPEDAGPLMPEETAPSLALPETLEQPAPAEDGISPPSAMPTLPPLPKPEASLPPEPEPSPPPASDAELLGAPLLAPEPSLRAPLPPLTAPPLPAPPAASRAATPSIPAPRAALPPEPKLPPVREPAPAPTPMPAPTLAPEPAPAPEPASSRAAGVPLPGEPRLFIHYTAGDEAAATRARELAVRLEERGAALVVTRSVPFAVRGLSIRYFHAQDRAGAAAVVVDAAAFAGRTPAPAGPSDFTDFTPAPRLGTIEIWLPGGS